MNIKDLENRIEETIRESFPDCALHVKYSSSLIDSIDIYFAHSKVWENGIKQNDPAYTILHVYGHKNLKSKNCQQDILDDNGNLVDEISIHGNVCGRVFLKNGEKVKVPFRKTSGSIQKVIDYIDNYFTRVKIAIENAKKEGKL